MNEKGKPARGPLSLYQQMRVAIIELIKERGLQPHDPVPSEGELSELYGVSRRTSKQALEMLAKEGIVYRMPRRGTFLAKHPEHKDTASVQASVDYDGKQLIGIVVPAIDDYVGTVISGGLQTALEHGCDVLFRISDGLLSKEEEILQELSGRSDVTGIILFPGDRLTCGQEVLRLHLTQYPIVIVDRTYREINIPSVYHDHFQGAYDITKYLIQKGHTNIGFVTEQVAGIMSREERYQGYIQAQLEHHVTFQMRWLYTNFSHKDEDLEHFIKSNKDLTAVFCSNDYVALHLMNVAGRLGIHIPDQLSVVGFTDFPVSEMLPVPLTTVRKAGDVLGASAVKLLLGRLSGGGDSLPGDIKLKAEIVERESVKTLS